MTAPARSTEAPTAALPQQLSPTAPLWRPSERTIARTVSVIFWTAAILYVGTFSLISLRQYDAYVSHALDLGNMAQAFWNTVHGHPFHFQNMRAHVNIEAFGTDTRLSFHVEPIIPFLAIFYFFWQHVQLLLVLQSVAVASGAIPARLLARRRLQHPIAEVVFPLAYLLFPALEAANLYEFHPVTFAAPLLLWAFYFAEARRYTLFIVTAFAAIGCKEELGILVTLIGLWIALRNGERRFGTVVAVLSVTWSLVALKVIVPHFSGADSSYWSRYLPPGYPVKSYPITPGVVFHYWLSHPGSVISDLLDDAKRSYVHRILYPTGYLALLSPLTILAGVPSLFLILLSQEPHMYGGLAHYSAELVPVIVVSSILGTEWLCRNVAPRLRVPYQTAIVVCCLYVLFAAAANHRANGLSPLSRDFYFPAITAHDRVLDSVLAAIPPDAAVSAQDNLNAHLSDREQIYLYPDLDKGRVSYIVLDATQPAGSVIRPCDLAVQVTGDPTACDIAAGPATPQPRTPAVANQLRKSALLNSGKWTIVRAEDGILLLKRHRPGEPLNTTLPAAFFTFAVPPPAALPPLKPIARFGPYLELDGFGVRRVEHANLRNPDVVVDTWWRVLKPLPGRARMMHYLTDSTGALQVFSDDQQTTDWIPLSRWVPGRTYKVSSYQLSITTNHNGNADVDLGLTTNDRQYLNLTYNQTAHLLSNSGTARVVGNGKVLQIAQVAIHL